MATSKKLDLSSTVGDLFPDEEDVKYVEADFGPIGTLRIVQSLNLFLTIQTEDNPGAIAKMMTRLIHPEDQRRFLNFIENRKDLDAEALLKLFNLMTEVATGGRPTNSPPASSAGTAKKAAARRSAAS